MTLSSPTHRLCYLGLLLVACALLSACCYEVQTVEVCAACLKEPACKYCTSMQGGKNGAQARAFATQELCRALVGVPDTGVDTASEASCLAAPEGRFEVTCDKLHFRKWIFEGMPPLQSLRARR